MLQKFMEENRKLLMFYYRVVLVGGWVFLSFAFVAAIGHSVALLSRIGDWNDFVRYFHNDVPWGIFSNGLTCGLLALGIAQLIMYLLNTDSKLGWVLRNAPILVYLYTGILMVYYCGTGMNALVMHSGESRDFLLRSIMLTAFILTKLLVLIGSAEILRRLLPVIDESRTLV